LIRAFVSPLGGVWCADKFENIIQWSFCVNTCCVTQIW
jgi:hypothetical protein